MNINAVEKIMKVILIIGLTLIIFGAYLAMFTTVTVSMGSTGILMIGLLLGLGLLLFIPSKIFLLLRFFQNKK